MERIITIGDKYNPAMEVQTKEEAAAYFEECVQHQMLRGVSREEAERIERNNIGYYAGYFGPEIKERVYSLYGVTHPGFLG